MRATKRMALLMIIGLCPLSARALRVVDQQVILDQLADYELCQKKDYSGDWCHDAMKRWVKANPADAFEAGKLTRQKMNSHSALPFFAQAFAAGKGKCADDDVKLAIIGGLGLPPDSELVPQARKLAEICLPELKEDLMKAGADSYQFKNSCSLLKAKGWLSSFKSKKCS
jgi:hypothetical protein